MKKYNYTQIAKESDELLKAFDLEQTPFSATARMHAALIVQLFKAQNELQWLRVIAEYSEAITQLATKED